MNTKIAVAAGMAAILAGMFAIPQAALAADVNVDITPGSSTKTTDAFAPNPVEANVGDTVIWTNKDSTVHTATSGSNATPDGMFGGTTSAPTIIAPSATMSFTFTEAGEFPYFCVLHPTMVGTVTVAENGGNGNTTESTATATLDGNDYEVTAMSATSMITAAEIDPEERMVTLTFDQAGDVELTLPTDMISNITAVMAGDEEIEFDPPVESGNSTTLTFTIPEGETEVDIMASFVVPEFPVVAVLVVGITVAAIVGYTRFAKGSAAGFFGRV